MNVASDRDRGMVRHLLVALMHFAEATNGFGAHQYSAALGSDCGQSNRSSALEVTAVITPGGFPGYGNELEGPYLVSSDLPEIHPCLYLHADTPREMLQSTIKYLPTRRTRGYTFRLSSLQRYEAGPFGQGLAGPLGEIVVKCCHRIQFSCS